MMRTILLAFVWIGGWTPAVAQGFQNTAPGFFLDAFRPKTVPIPAGLEDAQAPPPGDAATVTVRIYPTDTLGRVSPWLFGNNANQWMGAMVDQPVLLDHIRTLAPRIIRYPGGNGSNTFFWNASPGHLPADVPDTLLYGEGIRTRKERYFTGQGARGLSVDNYYRMLKATGSQGIICVNLGYARYGTGPDPVATAAHMAADWVRYDHGRTRFWELGNENYGPWQAGYLVDSARLPADPQTGAPRPGLISGDLYGQQSRVFIDSMRAAAREVGSDIRIGIVLVELPPSKWARPVERDWDQGVLHQAGTACDFFIVHSYYTPYKRNSDASAILSTAIPVTNRMMDYMRSLGDKPVALTEYNIFAEGSRQQVSFVAGMHATLVLGQLATRGYGMASRWDLANAYEGGNDHGLFNKGDEPGAPLWNPRPGYYYLYYFQRCFGDHLVRSFVEGDSGIVVFASAFTGTPSGFGLVVINTGTATRSIHLSAPGMTRAYCYSLTGGDDNGEFSARVFVNGRGPAGVSGTSGGTAAASGGPPDLLNIPAERLAPGDSLISPPRSVQYIVLY